MATTSSPPTRLRLLRLSAGLSLAVGATFLAPTFAASSDTWDRLAQCESGKRWDANTGNGYYGGLQFSAGTWRAYGGTAFADKAHLATRTQQITVAERLLADRGWGPWPACSAKLKLTAADALGNPFPAHPTPTPTPKPVDPTAPPSPPTPTTEAPPTADAATALAAAERKAANTAAKAVKKQSEADAAKLKADRAVRNARKAPPEQWAARAPKVTRLQNAANTAADAAARAQTDADRAARKLRTAQAAAGVTP
ncbi:MAG TPA: transglycosylase family protein [Sporichthya sp.]|nr:transglycosylase family protein [Sporichthya sp.]